MAFYWLLVALAVLDSENFWLPNWLTLPGTALGILCAVLNAFSPNPQSGIVRSPITQIALNLAGIVIAAGLVLLIRWIYWLVRRQEGMGLGDAKLMAMLAAWLGLRGALLSFGIGVVLGALYGLLLTLPAARREQEQWGASKLPLGTFLCIGGIVSSYGGDQIISAYLRWAGL
jgi:leader peptidase (prepilin peptidase)/N-methyltransferase